jgi:hypothetical protein
MQETYRARVRGLTPDTAGRLELGEGDHPITERARLKAAAKAEGVYLEIRRRGNVMSFWLTDQPPPTRKSPRGRAAQGGTRSAGRSGRAGQAGGRRAR